MFTKKKVFELLSKEIRSEPITNQGYEEVVQVKLSQKMSNYMKSLKG